MKIILEIITVFFFINVHSLFAQTKIIILSSNVGTEIDRKNRQVNLSVFALEKSQEKELIKENISKNKQIESETKTSIGDLIQEELGDSSKD